MDARLRQTLTGAFLATGCLFSASSHAYNAADDAEAQDREVKAAYDRGYKAAKEELAREAAAKGNAATTPPATEARARRNYEPPRLVTHGTVASLTKIFAQEGPGISKIP